jgi:uncharacterized protein YdeI (YjbR/CyaY-like superfamily)
VNAKKDLPVKRFRSQRAWEKWLAAHHESAPGLWLEFAEKGSGLVSLSHAEALEGALSYGWIDGQALLRATGQPEPLCDSLSAP